MSQELSVEGQHESIGKDTEKVQLYWYKKERIRQQYMKVSFEGARDINDWEFWHSKCNVPLPLFPRLLATSPQIGTLYWNERLYARPLMNR